MTGALFRCWAGIAVLRFMTILAAFETDNMESLVNAFHDNGVSFIQIQGNGHRQGLIQVHFHANPGELPPGGKHRIAVDLNRLSNLFGHMNEHGFVEVVNGQFFKSNPDCSLRAGGCGGLKIRFPRLHCQVMTE